MDKKLLGILPDDELMPFRIKQRQALFDILKTNTTLQALRIVLHLQVKAIVYIEIELVFS